MLGDKANIVFLQRWRIIVSEFVSTYSIVGESVISSSRDREYAFRVLVSTHPSQL